MIYISNITPFVLLVFAINLNYQVFLDGCFVILGSRIFCNNQYILSLITCKIYTLIIPRLPLFLREASGDA